jgi:hypothetical protein
MKKLMISFCLLGLLLWAGSASGQSEEVNNGYWLNGGQVMELRQGELAPLTERLVLPNGLTLFPNGDLVTREGVRRSLQSGQAIDAFGRILFPQTQRDGSVVLVPRRAYIMERDPGLLRQRKAARPSNPTPGYYRQRGAPAGPAPGFYRKAGPPAGRPIGRPPGQVPGNARGRIR